MTLKLNVRAVGTAMVPDYEAHEHGRLRFVGRKFVRGDAAKGTPAHFAPLPDPVQVPCRAEYIAELREGTLEPADEATAVAAGIQFGAKPGANEKG